MKNTLRQILADAVIRVLEKSGVSNPDIPQIFLDAPKVRGHGDYATNIAMVLAAQGNHPPRAIAEAIVDNIVDQQGMIDRTEIAGPGFINFFIHKAVWVHWLKRIEEQGRMYGRTDIGHGQRVQVEFVSANPTGPLHVGHGRGAALGDALANLLRAEGYRVAKEYYINNVGNQMETLGRSVWTRYCQILGKEVPFASQWYQGNYIFEVARAILEQRGKALLAWPEAEAVPFCTSFAVAWIMEGVRKDLRDFGVHFQNWYSEKKLYATNMVHRTIENLKRRDLAYEKDGALWFRSTRYGDEKDRVLVKADGSTTYFASDIAYHSDKYRRGFDLVINIWGADHHGYIPRMKAAVQALGRREDDLRILLVQFVNLLIEGKPLAMSTRAGQFTTVREVLDEVGRDAARFFFLMRRSDSSLDFDLALAKKKESDNPVYYVQYAHARISSVLREARKRGISLPIFGDIERERLCLPEEIDLIKMLTMFPDTVEGSVRSLEPHRICFYAQELASLFHAYYNLGSKNTTLRIIGSDQATTNARLFLAKVARIVLENSLKLLGVSAPKRM